jgi:hypothetical protein
MIHSVLIRIYYHFYKDAIFDQRTPKKAESQKMQPSWHLIPLFFLSNGTNTDDSQSSGVQLTIGTGWYLLVLQWSSPGNLPPPPSPFGLRTFLLRQTAAHW